MKLSSGGVWGALLGVSREVLAPVTAEALLCRIGGDPADLDRARNESPGYWDHGTNGRRPSASGFPADQEFRRVEAATFRTSWTALDNGTVFLGVFGQVWATVDLTQVFPEVRAEVPVAGATPLPTSPPVRQTPNPGLRDGDWTVEFGPR